MDGSHLFVDLFENHNCHVEIVVREHIHTVYKVLHNEGVHMIITKHKIEEGEDTEGISIDDIPKSYTEQYPEISYSIDVDMSKSFISMKKFNELIDQWEVDQFGINPPYS